MKIINSIITQPIWGVLTGLVGFYFGQRFNLWRDRRKEFNDITLETFTSLCDHVEGKGRGISISTKTRMLIEPYIFPCKREGFRKTVKNYNDAQNYTDGIYDPVTGGGLTINESKFEHYRSCAEKLLCYLRRR